MRINQVKSSNPAFGTKIPKATKFSSQNVVNDFWPQLAEKCSINQEDTYRFNKLMGMLKSDRSNNILALDYKETANGNRYIFRLYDSFEKLNYDRTKGNVFESNSITGMQISVVNSKEFPKTFFKQYDYFDNRECKSKYLVDALLETLEEILTPKTESNRQIFPYTRNENINLDLFR